MESAMHRILIAKIKEKFYFYVSHIATNGEEVGRRGWSRLNANS